ncbi:hypothetical protein LMG27174_03443 [Paraburkholderia rhynchosiae]|uniref:Uncharacterized protein n=1 Tax=Paraburkholderia rhynchosiae TaxID=487049 RepID=A0A2N7WKK9_9BURK|nr:hypothetical protein C0Z16_15745 [Paraburkholderia rhynchosiae]CAB3696381.1 hypothetical protein LMG27174_03443 [Paraburkholderia rhynchosiae]
MSGLLLAFLTWFATPALRTCSYFPRGTVASLWLVTDPEEIHRVNSMGKCILQEWLPIARVPDASHSPAFKKRFDPAFAAHTPAWQ